MNIWRRKVEEREDTQETNAFECQMESCNKTNKTLSPKHYPGHGKAPMGTRSITNLCFEKPGLSILKKEDNS